MLADRLFHDMLGALELFTVYLGERLGLYRALDSDGPATSAELAERTGTTERYVREWLEHHAASGLLEVDDPAADPLARRYRLPPAYVPVLADPDDILIADELVADAFTAPASDLERYHYGWSVVACLPGAMGDPGTAATGAVMRPATLGRYAREAGFRSMEVLPLQTQTLQFYQLLP